MLLEYPKRILGWLSALALVTSTLPAQEQFDTLRIGVVTYSNVMVVSKTPADLFITHAQGLSNIKVRDLDDATAEQLGFFGDGQRPKPARAMPKLQINPEVERLHAQLNEEFNERLGEELNTRFHAAPKGLVFGILGGIALIYLFGCYCCKLICDKAGAPSKLMVWVPGLQMFALFRAAKMSPMLAFGYLVPQFVAAAAAVLVPEQPALGDPKLFVMVTVLGLSLLVPFVLHIVWCAKIARARDKSGLIAFALWFPPTSLLAFLYLAFSGGSEPEPVVSAQRPNYVTFS